MKNNNINIQSNVPINNSNPNIKQANTQNTIKNNTANNNMINKNNIKATSSEANITNTTKPLNNILNNPQNTKNIDFTKMPVVDAVNKIILTAVTLGASDIHFDPTENGINVRLRIDGILNDYFFLPLEIKQNVTTRIK